MLFILTHCHSSIFAKNCFCQHLCKSYHCIVLLYKAVSSMHKLKKPDSSINLRFTTTTISLRLRTPSKLVFSSCVRDIFFQKNAFLQIFEVNQNRFHIVSCGFAKTDSIGVFYRSLHIINSITKHANFPSL